MKKAMVLTIGIILLSVGITLAQQSNQPEQSMLQLQAVGNKHCPVTGEEVGKMGPPLTYEYKGKLYNICCPGCKNAFKNDPEKYSKIAQDDVKITP